MELLSGLRTLRRGRLDDEAVTETAAEGEEMIGKGFGVMIFDEVDAEADFSCKETILWSMFVAGY